MKKKLTALFLALVMCMTMSAPAFAVESTSVAAMEKAAHEDAIRAEIMRQLEAQDAVHLYDAFEAIFLPDETSQTYGTYANTVRYYAPDGGSTYFTRPYTYRGENGTYTYLIHHLDAEATQLLLEDINSEMELIQFLDGLYGLWGNITNPFSIPTIQDMLADAGKEYLIKMKILALDFSADLIHEANDYARVVTVEGSIDGSYATVAAGWEDYPYAVIDYNDAENRVFDYYPSH